MEEASGTGFHVLYWQQLNWELQSNCHTLPVSIPNICWASNNCQPLCLSLYIDQASALRFLLYQWIYWGFERLSILSTVTQLGSGGGRIHSQVGTAMLYFRDTFGPSIDTDTHLLASPTIAFTLDRPSHWTMAVAFFLYREEFMQPHSWYATPNPQYYIRWFHW